MTATALIERVRDCLCNKGKYRPPERSDTVVSVPFELSVLLVASPPSADLVLVVDTAIEGMERIRRRIEAFGRALDSMRSRQSVTAVLVGPRPNTDTLNALLRCCRVLVVEPREHGPTDAEISDRLAVLLPLSLTEPLSELANPDGALDRHAEGLSNREHLASLIDASRRGQEAVRAALGALLEEPLATLANEDEP